MSDWSAGYVTDLNYEAAFFMEQSPTILRLACLLNSVETPPDGSAFTYCDLGCGEGLTLLILAAANPRGRFVGVDFNPVHIMRARSLAAAAGLANVEFLERSFEDLLDDPLPEFDFVAMHGVYSWVSPELRRSIVRFLSERLKAGGIVYVSYNCMPGWTSGLAMQRLLHDVGARASGRSDQKILSAISVLEKLKSVEARALLSKEFIDDVIELKKQGRAGYLAHEYLNDHWHPMFHADVARELAAAKLSYAGSADLLANIPQFTVTPEQREVIAGLDSPVMQETVRDLCCNRRFRRDVYIRGLRRMSDARQEAQFQAIRLAPLAPREDFRMKVKVAAGTAELPPAYAAIADALATRPWTGAELLELPEVREMGGFSAGEIVGVLVGSIQAMSICDPAAIDPAPADRLNRVLAAGFEDLAPNVARGFAVPLFGGGVSMGYNEALVFRRLMLGKPLDVDELAREALRAVTSRGHKVLKDGVPVQSEVEALAVTRGEVSTITSRLLPVWLRYWPHLRQAAGLPA